MNYDVGPYPQALVTADFNGDGRPDVATGIYDYTNGATTIGVLLANGDGTFQPPQSIQTGGPPTSLAVGDFNADGRTDLATTVGGQVKVLRGNGNGTFQTPVEFDVNFSGECVAVGDFNGDARLDLVVTSNSDSAYANVLLGNGAGLFAAPISSWLGDGYHRSAAVADFDGDGKQDFAAVNVSYGTVTVVRGTGTGTFGSPTAFDVGTTPYAVAARDLSGDGKPDVVTANVGSSSVSVLLGNGLGSFSSAQNYATDYGPQDVAIADFNRDGTPDLVTANPSAGRGALSVLLGSGGGDFKPPLTVVDQAGPFNVAVADFNGDGRPDAVSGNTNSRSVSALLNDGNWPAIDAPSIAISGAGVVEGNTGTVGATFRVTLSAASSETATVHYATADEGVPVSDYQPTSGDVVFAPGETTQVVTVLVNGDRIDEDVESFVVELSNPINAFIAHSIGTGTIADDDPSLSIVGNVAGDEGQTGTTPFVFTVTLSAPYDVPVTVDYATADPTPDEAESPATAGIDYVATAGTLTIPAGQASATITVPVIGDRLGEGDEQFFLNLTNPSLGRPLLLRSTGVIAEDEPYVSISGGSSVVEGNSGARALPFTVSISAAYDIDVTVSYITADGTASAGSDYVAAADTVTIPAGWMSQTLNVAVNGDVLPERDEYLLVNLIGASGLSIAGSVGQGWIMDDDTPPPPMISINDVTRAEGRSGQTLFVFTVTLSAPFGQPVTVSFRTVSGSATAGNDYTAKSGTITFAPGETTKTIAIVVKGDNKKEVNETFSVELYGASSNALLLDPVGLGTILNDD